MDITALIDAIARRRGDQPFPARLSAEQWALLGDGALQRRELAPGELLIRRGEVGDAAYLVESGRLQVFVTGGPPRSHRVATLTAGTIVGEPGWFAPTERMAHVEAVTSSVVWGLAAGRIDSFAQRAPALAIELLRAAGAVMAARMRANLERGIPVA